MTPIELSNAAIADIEDILAYGVANFGAEIGEDYVAGFEACIALIGEHPMAGAVHGVVRPPIRSIAHGSHRVYYDVLAGQILVQRIIHHKMDVEQHL